MIGIVGRVSMIELLLALHFHRFRPLPPLPTLPMSDSGCDGRKWRGGPLRGRHRELRLIFGRQLIPMRLRNRRVVTVLDDVRPHGLGVGVIYEAPVVYAPTEWHDAPLAFR